VHLVDKYGVSDTNIYMDDMLCLHTENSVYIGKVFRIGRDRLMINCSVYLDYIGKEWVEHCTEVKGFSYSEISGIQVLK